jgi:hypothetical protein
MRGSNAVLLRGPSNQTNAQEEIKRVTTTPTNVTTANSSHDYALGYTNSEHERLIRQAARIAPYTERLFREAGIGPGQRVLDLGSGVGDVSNVSPEALGNLDTLSDRIQAEVVASNTVVSFVPMVGVWSRKPMST